MRRAVARKGTDDRIPGPITRRLMAAFTDLVGMDYEAQYLAHLPQE